MVRRLTKRPLAWSDSVLLAIIRVLKSRNSTEFTRKELIDQGLNTIKRETNTSGNTPKNTLSLTIGKLFNKGLIEYVGPGKYRLLKKG